MELTKPEIINCLNRTDDMELFALADKTRKEFCGEKVYIRGIVEFSNYCVRQCLYCGLRHPNENAERFRLTDEEIVKAVEEVYAEGIRTVVLQSGDDFFYTRELLCAIIRGIKRRFDMAVTLSLGERPFDDYRAFKDAGADRYLLKHEAISEEVYLPLHPMQSLKARLEILEFLRKIGFQVGSGNIVGLPGQTCEHLAADVLFYQDFQPDMIGIGPFMPQAHTPLAAHPSPPVSLVLKMLALARIVTQDAHMPVTTALATLGGEEGQIMGLQAGCNVIMPNFTPLQRRLKYRIYDNKTEVTLKKAQDIIQKAGRLCSLERGDSLKS